MPTDHVATLLAEAEAADASVADHIDTSMLVRRLCEALRTLQLAASADTEPIDVVFDGPPAHESGRFIEVEDATGAGVSVGEWIDRGNGYWALRFNVVRSDVARGGE